MKRAEFETDVVEITKGHLANMVGPLESMVLMLGPLGFAETEVHSIVCDVLDKVRAAAERLAGIADRTKTGGDN